MLNHGSWQLFVGEPGPTAEALLMGAGWLIDLAVAEWLIRRPAGRPAPVPTLQLPSATTARTR